MSWDRLVAFVQMEAPSFMASVKGVSPDEIARVESDYRLRLPDNYRRFLLLMGDDSAGFYLFGRGQDQRFANLITHGSDASYPERYFKIARAIDDSLVTRLDHFLDLARTDGVDAPIVMFETDGDEDFDPDNVIEKGFTFLEHAYRRLFAHVADERAPERVMVAIPSGPGGNEPSSLGDVVRVLEQMRFTLALGPLERVAGLRRGDIWALVATHLDGRGFAVSLWSDERSGLEGPSDQLLIHYPNATAHSRGRLHAV